MIFFRETLNSLQTVAVVTAAAGTLGWVWLALILFSWSGWVRYRRTRIPV